jgi:hypothetical protein
METGSLLDGNNSRPEAHLLGRLETGNVDTARKGGWTGLDWTPEVEQERKKKGL